MTAPQHTPTDTDPAGDFAAALRARRRLLGYWSCLDAPAAVERIACLGWDYIALDAQHGLFGHSGMLADLQAVDSRGSTAVGLVRVESKEPAAIGHALDAGAAGVIVPLVDSPQDAADAVAAVRYPPAGRRSFGPMRSQLYIGPDPAEANRQNVVIVMIETSAGLADVERICAVPGLDGVYVGPSDLRIGIGGSSPSDPSVDAGFEQALRRIAKAAEAAGIASGIHTHDGALAARRLGEGFTFATVASDLDHLEQASRGHLDAARGNAR